MQINEIGFELSKAMDRKNEIVNSLHQGVKQLVNKEKITIFKGTGRILGPSIFSPTSGTISVEYDDERENDMLIPKNVLISTGASPVAPSKLGVDGGKIVTSDHLLELKELPESITILGGGVIGVEWASFFCDLGVKVTIVEAAKTILPQMDQDLAKQMKGALENRGATIYENSKLQEDSIEQSDNSLTIKVTRDGEEYSLETEKLLVSIGRAPNTKNIGIENTDIKTNKNGFIEINEFYQTKEDHIYAIGDVIEGKQLAHVAMQEAELAVEHMSGEKIEKLKNEHIPSCVYSYPEIASIGLTENEVKSKGFEFEIAKIPFKMIGKAKINGQDDGFAKIIINKENDDLLGAHLIGDQATEMITQLSLAKYLDASASEMDEMVYPHPSLSEIIGEAVHAIKGRNVQ